MFHSHVDAIRVLLEMKRWLPKSWGTISYADTMHPMSSSVFTAWLGSADRAVHTASCLRELVEGRILGLLRDELMLMDCPPQAEAKPRPLRSGKMIHAANQADLCFWLERGLLCLLSPTWDCNCTPVLHISLIKRKTARMLKGKLMAQVKEARLASFCLLSKWNPGGRLHYNQRNSLSDWKLNLYQEQARDMEVTGMTETLT